jgi:hypothetical protein
MHRGLLGRKGEIPRHSYGVGIQENEQQQNKGHIAGRELELDTVFYTDTLDISL